jgi:hypothetical protein
MKPAAKEFSQSFAPDSQYFKRRQKHDPPRNKTESLVHSSAVPAENDEFLAALDKIRERAGINSNDVSDRIVCQAGTATAKNARHDYRVLMNECRKMLRHHQNS